MTWAFTRNGQRAICEIRRDEGRFNLTMRHPDGTISVESVETSTELLERIVEMPRALIEEGWRPAPAHY